MLRERLGHSSGTGSVSWLNREELYNSLHALAQDRFVDVDHGTNVAIAKIREALGDSSEEPPFDMKLYNSRLDPDTGRVVPSPGFAVLLV